jgi:sulfite exporter TauE/SafE
MTANVGMIDRVLRIIIGVLLIAFALRVGFPETSWNWIGWIGVVPILTAIFSYCPAYSVVGLSTCPLTRKTT